MVSAGYQFQLNVLDLWTADYEGVSFSSRTSNSKAAASELSSIFQSHYPEFLVSACICDVALLAPL